MGKRKPHISTVVVRKGPKGPKRDTAEERDGVRVGQVFENTRIGALQVKSLHRYGSGPWQARVITADRHMENMPVSELSDILRGKISYPHGCYTVGKARIRRRKVNPARRRPVSGCYAVGKARIRRRKVNPARRRPVSGCYAVGKARIRRRKVNPASDLNAPFPRRPFVVLYAQRPGGPRLKYLSRGKFGTKGAPRLFRGKPEAMLAAWILKDTFPDVLRPYRLFAQ